MPPHRTRNDAAERDDEVVLTAWLHISDIHFGHGIAGYQWDQQLIASDLRRDAREVTQMGLLPAPDRVFVSGDVAFSGGGRMPVAGVSEYELARRWLEDLAGDLELGLEHIFVVPGNHDVDRKVDASQREIGRLVRGAREGRESLDDLLEHADEVECLRRRMSGYLDFSRAFRPPGRSNYLDGLWWRNQVPLRDGVSLRICGVNTALLSADDEDQGRLRVGSRQLADLLMPSPSKLEIVVVLSHHPFTGKWLGDEEIVRGHLYREGGIHLFGHLHEGDSEQARHGWGPGCIKIAAGAVHAEAAPAGKAPVDHGYNFGALILRPDGELVVRVWPRRWSSKSTRFVADTDNIDERKGYAEHVLGHRVPRRLATPELQLEPPDRDTAAPVLEVRRASKGDPVPIPRLAELGVRHADGLTLRFYRGIHELSTDESSGWSSEAIDLADELHAWALVQGADNVAVLAISDAEKHGSIASCVAIARSNQTIALMHRNGESIGVAEEQLRRAILGSIVGANELDIEAAPEADASGPAELDQFLEFYHSEVTAELAMRRSRKLEEVKGHFEDLDLCEGNAAASPALEALHSWRHGADALALLLGEYGRGKSTLLTVWAHEIWKAKSGPFPVLVSLLEAPSEEAPMTLLLRALKRPDTPQERARLALLVRYRRFIPVFDGLDEVATRINRHALSDRLRALAATAGRHGKVLISTRDHLFSSDAELDQLLPGARRFTVQPLSEAQVQNLVTGLVGTKATAAVLERIRGIYDLRDLVRRPLLLGMVVSSLDRLGPGVRVADVDVYDAYVDKWLENSHVGAPEALSDSEKRLFAEALAVALWQRGEPSCTWDDVRKCVVAACGERLLDDNVDNHSLFFEIKSSAFICREQERFRFAHRSFHEFFLAKALLRRLHEAVPVALATRAITDEVVDFVRQLLQRQGGEMRSSPAIRAVQTWLINAAEGSRLSDPLEYDPRANALRLLLGLARLEADGEAWVPEGADLRHIRLRRHDLRGARLSGVHLDHAILSGADLSGADLRGASLTHAVLRGVCIARADLRGVDARYVDLRGADVDATDLRGADLSSATLDFSTWIECRWEGVIHDDLGNCRAVIFGSTPGTPTRVWFDIGRARIVSCNTESYTLGTAAIPENDVFAVLQRYPLVECRYICAETGAPFYAHVVAGKRFQHYRLISAGDGRVTLEPLREARYTREQVFTVEHPELAITAERQGHALIVREGNGLIAPMPRLEGPPSEAKENPTWATAAKVVATLSQTRDKSAIDVLDIFRLEGGRLQRLANLRIPLEGIGSSNREIIAHPRGDVFAVSYGNDHTFIIDLGAGRPRLGERISGGTPLWLSDRVMLVPFQSSGVEARRLEAIHEPHARVEDLLLDFRHGVAVRDEERMAVNGQILHLDASGFVSPRVGDFKLSYPRVAVRDDRMALAIVYSAQKTLQGRILDLKSGVLRKFSASSGHVSGVTWDESGEWVCVERSGMAELRASIHGDVQVCADPMARGANPSGRFVVTIAGNHESIEIFDRLHDNTRAVTLSRGSNVNGPGALAWSPVGDELVVADKQLFVISATTGEAETISLDECSRPQWSADGRWIFALGAEGIVIHDFAERRGRRISLPGAGRGLWCSPSGRWAVVRRTEERPVLVNLHAPEREPQELDVDAAAFEVEGVTWSRDESMFSTCHPNSESHVWSTAGRRLFTAVVSDAEACLVTDAGLWWFDRDGPRHFRLEVPDPERDDTRLFFPLGGLRRLLAWPEVVLPALRGERPERSLTTFLEAAGWPVGLVTRS